MNMERNRFEYGHIIDQNTFEQTAEEIKREVCEKINFKNGILREINEVQFNNGIILDVRWKKDVHFVLCDGLANIYIMFCEMENRYQAVIGLRGMTKRFYAKYNFW